MFYWAIERILSCGLIGFTLRNEGLSRKFDFSEPVKPESVNTVAVGASM